MPGPGDERIKRFLDRRIENAAASERAEQKAAATEDRRQNNIMRIRTKWAEDTHVINAVVRELNQKLATAECQLNFQDMGAASDRGVAHGRIMGRLSSSQVDIAISVRAHGAIEVSAVGPNSPIKSSSVSIFEANKGEYEALILDALGVD
jgi:hypothetical protein